jgi:SAM-dependent methyltransferase
MSGEPKCPLCGAAGSALLAEIRSRPARETDFGVPAGKYLRRLFRCGACGVYHNAQDMVGPEVYEREYNKATYNRDLTASYRRIRALPEEKSDNKQRVKRVAAFLEKRKKPAETSVLDVGSGLCVFLGELKERGFQCYCVDPDPLSAKHALSVGVDGAHAGTLEDYAPGRTFDLLTFNKVLEHVADSAAMLRRAAALGGTVYVEVPDGEAAYRAGGAVDREEFFIEHYTAFSPASFEKLAEKAGFKVLEAGRLHEPSDKYTIYGFLKATPSP